MNLQQDEIQTIVRSIVAEVAQTGGRMSDKALQILTGLITASILATASFMFITKSSMAVMQNDIHTIKKQLDVASADRYTATMASYDRREQLNTNSEQTDEINRIWVRLNGAEDRILKLEKGK